MSASEVTHLLNHFQINIIGANGFKPNSYYIDVTVDMQKFSTKASDSKRPPAWNQSFNFSWKEGDIVTIAVFKAQLLGWRKYLGKCEIPINEINDVSQFGREQTRAITLESNEYGQSHEVVFKTRDVQATFGNIDPKRIFALLIGVKRYKSEEMPNLEGPVNDIKTLNSFLRVDLKVGESHIKTLVNEEATRKGILDAIFELINRPDIEYNDTILFYFSGHGSQSAVPDGWTSPNGKVEYICPYDTGTGGGAGVPSIPDRTLSALFRKLATKHGDNIITVFDCCHSGGMVRGDDNPDGARIAVDIPPISKDLDREIWTWDTSRHCKPAQTSLTYEGATSHIFLAAAQAGQVAWECDVEGGKRSGAFTRAFITELRKPDFGQITYQELMDRLPRPLKAFKNQVALCEGANLNRFLFRREGRRRTGVFEMMEKGQGMVWTVQKIGEVHGVVIGSLFEVREREQPASEKSLGVLVVSGVDKFSTTLERRKGDAHFDVPVTSVVTLHRFNNFILKVFIDNSKEDDQGNYKVDLPPPDKDQTFFQLLDGKYDAHIQLYKDTNRAPNNELLLERLDREIYPNHTLLFTPESPTQLQTILNAISHFHYHLNRTTSSHNLDVKIELYRVKQPDRMVLISRHTMEDEWTKRVDDDDILLGDDKVKLEDEPGAMYGIDIVNSSTSALYPYLFYFDPSDYSISLIYEPPNKKEAALPSKQPSRVTIGYGAHSYIHDINLTFNLRPGESSDTGYLKLFVSTQYVDMKWLEQRSTFTHPPSPKEIKEKSRNTRTEWFKALQKDLWDTSLVQVTVLKKKSELQATS